MFRIVLAVLCLTACGQRTLDADHAVDTSSARSTLEDAAILWTANNATLAELDFDVALDTRAAVGVHQGRPFATVAEVDAVRYVGSVSLQRMADYGMPMVEARADALQLVLDATPEFLEAFTGADDTDVWNWQHNPNQPWSMEHREAIEAWIALRTTCPPNQVVAAGGEVYPDLETAYREGPAALMLCEGEHVFDFPLDNRSNVFWNGLGEGTLLRVDRPTSPWSRLGWSELGTLRLTGDDLTLDGGSLVKGVEVENRLTLGYDAQQNVVVEDSIVRGMLRATQNARVENTSFVDGGHLAARYSWGDWTNLTVVDSHFEGAATALSVDYGSYLGAMAFRTNVHGTTFVGNGEAIAVDMDHNGTLQVRGSAFEDNGVDLIHTSWSEQVPEEDFAETYALPSGAISCTYAPLACTLY